MGLIDELRQSLTESLKHNTNLVSEAINYADLDDSVIDGFIKIQSAIISTGGDFDYSDGVFSIDFRHWAALGQCAAYLDDIDAVSYYEILVFHKGDSYEQVVVDVEDILDDSKYKYTLIVYMTEDTSIYLDDDESEESVDESIQLDEVRRRIKVDSRGSRRVKMQCKPGFKWDGTACIKISGAELATNRRAHRRAVITKRSQGAAARVKVIRKTRKAKRFRKAMGFAR